MAQARKRSTYRTKSERALDEIYAEIPNIPDCTGECADACGPIAAFGGEWDRVKRSHGRAPRLNPGSLVCPLLSPTGKCTVYSVRPLICRLWGATEGLKCPRGCQPERMLSTEEAREIFGRVRDVAGPRVTGTLNNISDLWAGFALEGRVQRQAIIDRVIKEHME